MSDWTLDDLAGQEWAEGEQARLRKARREREQEANRADAIADLDAGVDTDGSELVEEAAACPECGNRITDELVWDEESGIVTCAKCGGWYDPEAE